MRVLRALLVGIGAMFMTAAPAAAKDHLLTPSEVIKRGSEAHGAQLILYMAIDSPRGFDECIYSDFQKLPDND